MAAGFSARLGSKCPGHPEYGHTTGVEMTTGPLGQGVASTVGMAMASKQHLGQPETAIHWIDGNGFQLDDWEPQIVKYLQLESHKPIFQWMEIVISKHFSMGSR